MASLGREINIVINILNIEVNIVKTPGIPQLDPVPDNEGFLVTIHLFL